MKRAGSGTSCGVRFVGPKPFSERRMDRQGLFPGQLDDRAGAIPARNVNP
jgi:hypothetical protein